MCHLLVLSGRAVFREPLAYLLRREPGVTTVVEAESAIAARALIAAGLVADVAIVELDPPGGDVPAVAAELRNAGTRVVALTAAVARPAPAWASATVSSAMPLAELLAVVRRLATGGANQAKPRSSAQSARHDDPSS
jgi:DNA-binding NarL/FixJ family response regulator